MSRERRCVQVVNAADGGLLYWLAKLYLFAACTLFTLAVASLPLLYLAVATRGPKPPDIASYADWAPLESRIVTDDGQLLTRLASERRYLARLADIPPLMVDAFLAAEDRNFFSHGGVDVGAIARATWKNLRAGRVRQGGSTITQQVAKALLSPERTLERKLNELVLARRLEARFTKQQILAFYLNHAFLGANSYGVKAAALEYFGKDLDQLTVAEMALIAGLVQAPSRYAPRKHPHRAKRRRDLVLARMQATGFIGRKACQTAQMEPIRLTTKMAEDPLPWIAPFFTAQVRGTLEHRYGRERLYSAGWSISTTIDPTLHALAREATLRTVRALDKRQGWRGPVARLRSPDAFRSAQERMARLYDTETLKPDRPYLAVVQRVRAEGATASIGARRVAIPLDMMSWAATYSRTDPENNRTIDSATLALTPGDLVWVSSPPRWKRRQGWGSAKDKRTVMMLDQRPRIEGALLLYDHQTGYVLAAVGGIDYDHNSYNRTSQACRQPGSTYKPIYYSLALDGDEFSMASVLQDKPYVPEPGEVWNPQNVHGTLDGEVSMHYALIRSLNLPSIQLLQAVGAEATKRWARRLGFTTKIIADKGLALGASCVRMDELLRAFATFARGGTQRDLQYIRQIRDRHGAVLEDHTVSTDPWLSEDDRLDRLWATSADQPHHVIDERTAFLITKLLRDAVLRGIAARCRIVPVPTAGKGGTSSDTLDTWFVGFTSRWAAAAWIGDDSNQRPLGAKEASYTSAIPMWANFMKAAVVASPKMHGELPQHRPPGLETAVIDMLSGGPPQPERPSVEIFYRPGTFTPPPDAAEPTP